jgi:ankyrin repeat protein
MIVLIAQFLLIFEATAGQIHDAARDGDVSAVERLLLSGTDVNEEEDRSGRTPLHEAARRRHLAVAILLLDEGAKVDAMDNLEKTPLWLAAWEGQTAVAELLIARGADINIADSSGRTPLHGATAMRQPNMVELLIRNGADLNARNDDGNTALLYGFHGNPNRVEEYSPIAELLISAGADIDSKGRGGSTALHYAASWGFYRVTELLIEKGADLDARDSTGRTPLQEAASGGRFETAELLITAGADIHTRNDLGFTLLHFAAQGGDIRLVTLLLEKGADVNAAAKDGRTPLNLAFQWQHLDIVNLLRERGAEKSRLCTTVADIKEMNRGGIRRLFTLRGIDAKVFLALDPRLLNSPKAFELLMEQDVDEIIAWRLAQRRILGAAVPFSGGCVVDGYGEPDMIDKIKLMEDILRLIKRHGPNDKRVRSRMEGLWEYEAPLPQNDLEAQVGALLDRVRFLLAAES